MRMRRKPNRELRMKCCETILPKSNEEIKDFAAGELHLELGCGKGKFTVENAVQNPQISFLAIEKSADVLVIAAERAMNVQIKNIRFIHSDIANLCGLLDGVLVDVIYINFCDPWPANRHAKRRLTSKKFIAIYDKFLKPGGEIRFKTDNPELFTYSLNEFKMYGFELTEITNDLHKDGITGVMTDYEEKFHNKGIPVCRCVAVKQI